MVLIINSSLNILWLEKYQQVFIIILLFSNEFAMNPPSQVYQFQMDVGERRKITPNRKRVFNNVQPIHEPQFYSNQNHSRNLYIRDLCFSSPIKLNASRKPLISRRGLMQKKLSEDIEVKRELYGIQECSNHRDKAAEFIVETDHEIIAYCEKCAIQIASRGFNVTKIQKNLHKTFPKAQQSFHSLKHEGKPEFQQIKQFIKTLNLIQQNHMSKISRLKTIQFHYQNQIKLTEKFYDQLVNIVIQIRNDHMDDLIKESQRHAQTAEMEINDLQENIENVKLFRSDIESGIDKILDDDVLTKLNFQTILNFYRNKVGFYQHKCEQVDEFLKDLIDYKTAFLSNRLQEIQQYIIGGWDTNVETVKNYQPITVGMKQISTVNMNQNQQKKGHSAKLPKKIANIVQIGQKFRYQQNGRGSCRKLFSEEEDDGIDMEKSPQFKNI